MDCLKGLIFSKLAYITHDVAMMSCGAGSHDLKDGCTNRYISDMYTHCL